MNVHNFLKSIQKTKARIIRVLQTMLPRFPLRVVKTEACSCYSLAYRRTYTQDELLICHSKSSQHEEVHELF